MSPEGYIVLWVLATIWAFSAVASYPLGLKLLRRQARISAGDRRFAAIMAIIGGPANLVALLFMLRKRP